jgi:nucleoside phosphorylase
MPRVYVLTATPGEFAGVKAALTELAPRHFECREVVTGPGKLNAAMWTARLLAKKGPVPDLILGAGTSGSLDLKLKAGDVVAVDETIVADWREEDATGWRTAAYGSFNYGPPEERAEKMVIRSSSPLVQKLMGRLSPDFLRGRCLSSDSFIAGQEYKLALGRLFGCRICEMEAGAVAHVCRLSGQVPWLQLRVVADTLDDALDDYFRIEKDMVKILGQKTFDLLRLLDENWTELAS